MTADEYFMQRCLQLAEAARGRVAPNPMVGALLTVPDEDAPFRQRIIAEGYHRQYGGPHAEVNAIEQVKDAELLRNSRLYVTLEPCSHYGKTPPCANLIVERQIPEVVVACRDPHEKVAGRGIQHLREHGVKVTEGVLEQQAQWLNRRFFTFHQQQRPYVVLKWAETADGFLARPDGTSKWISNPYSRILVHKWRSEESAILVGANTVMNDDPALTVRNWHGRHPLRLVVSRKGEVPEGAKLLRKPGRTLIFNLKKEGEEGAAQWVKLHESEPLLPQVLSHLHQEQVLSVLVEGGAYTLRHFIEAGLWDEARVFEGRSWFGSGIAAPALPQPPASVIGVAGDGLRIHYRQERLLWK